MRNQTMTYSQCRDRVIGLFDTGENPGYTVDELADMPKFKKLSPLPNLRRLIIESVLIELAGGGLVCQDTSSERYFSTDRVHGITPEALAANYVRKLLEAAGKGKIKYGEVQ